MSHFIDHIIEPDFLWLSWQAPAAQPDRMRRFVGKLIRRGDNADLVYLRDSEDFRIARERGFKEYPGLSTDVYQHPGVLPTFMKRLPPRTRTDFGRYLESIRIQPDARISDFALLGYSGAILPDDEFTLIHPFDTAIPPFEMLIPVQGYRYYQNNLPCSSVSPDMEAEFRPEPHNPHDPLAIQVYIKNALCGYVSRGLARQFIEWLAKGYHLSAVVERSNGSSDRPMMFLFVTVRN